MAITFLKREKIQKYLILLFIILVLATFLVVWFGFLRKPKPAPPAPYKPEKIEINFEVLKDSFLRESQPFKEIEPFEKTLLPEEELKKLSEEEIKKLLKEKIGRENPFLPY